MLALAFFVPLTDLSIVLSLFPWSRFPGWQWVLIALTAPVASASSFPVPALKNARHGASARVWHARLARHLASCRWSVYAMF